VLVLALLLAFNPVGASDGGPGASALAFVLAAGDRADICSDGEDTGHRGHGDCLACQLVGAPAIPGSDARLVLSEMPVVLRVVPTRESRSIRKVRDPCRGLRAPPGTA
jgi:hypothetical protein